MGALFLGEEYGLLRLLVFGEDDPRLQDYVSRITPSLEKAQQELDEYFAGKRQRFDLPHEVQGTEFQKRVWQELQTIPYGETRSYKDIAKQVQSPLASRAVGLANNKNPISIIIPCHRVVGQNGKLTGYAGGLAAKEYLLDLEQRCV
jgi:methylated-DNA-[protein]-cysteine S-methyltransferase